ncbi:hypothetical protein C0Q70_04027 [Pomacea canaliculata]|uniref:Amidohydrolase-related domain-containing protein n=1 Tax=Pomacea canaliculata TaxID=400727 RepID=A0A2T7PUC7_POMCA|nr:hypothetical protein C0Q70_04027 [Pomacea canaliculata]
MVAKHLSHLPQTDRSRIRCSTLPGLRKFIAEGSACRLYAFLHIAAHGLASAGCAGLLNGGECDSLNQLDVEQCVEAIKNNPDLVVGVKVRITASVADDGRNEQESYRRALQAAQNAAVPLMVHHSFSTIPKVKTEGFLSCPGDMIKGDIHTHTYHNHPGGIVDSSGRVIQDVLDARKRGVLFDVGHGAGSFSWDSLEACARDGFWPDLISTDLHVESMNGPAYDLTSVMTKLLHAGMPLVDVISAVTSKPAAAIGKSNIIGSLKVGMEADVTILRIEECSIELEDTVGQTRKVTKRIVPVRVFRAGKEYPIREYCEYPNLKSKAECLNRAKQYAKLAPTFVRK